MKTGHLDVVYGSDQQLHADSEFPASLQESTSPSSTHRYEHQSISPVGSHKGSEDGHTPDHTQVDSALFTQLELLHQECQEKEALIDKLSAQLVDWEELHTQLEKKEQQYVEALQAAESTIAYLTACSLDNQRGFGSQASLGTGSGSVVSDATLHSKCIELQRALHEKGELNKQLIELLNKAEQEISSFDNQEKNQGSRDLCLKIESALQQAKTSSNTENLSCDFGSTSDSMQELQRHADTLQEALWKQNRLNAELQEKLRAADASGTSHIAEKESNKRHREMEGSGSSNLNQDTTYVLLNCLSAAESAIASLAAHCSAEGDYLASDKSLAISPDLQVNLDKLQRALQERGELAGATYPTTKSIYNHSSAPHATKEELHQDLHQNLCLLYKIFSSLSQRISELQASTQEERGHREERDSHGTMQDGKALAPSVQVQLETLHKALREKKKTCKSLEEKLATALTKTPSPETARKGNTTSNL